MAAKYTPEFGKKFIEHMKQGFSITATAACLDISRSAVYKWAREHEEFKEALEQAKGHRLYFWESKLIEYGNASKSVIGVIFALKNISKEEWRESEASIESFVPLTIAKIKGEKTQKNG